MKQDDARNLPDGATAVERVASGERFATLDAPARAVYEEMQHMRPEITGFEAWEEAEDRDYYERLAEAIVVKRPLIRRY